MTMATVMDYAVALALVALAVGYAVLKELPRRRWEKPLREQMRAQRETFRASVKVKAGAVDPMTPERGPFDLSVRGGAFEVSASGVRHQPKRVSHSRRPSVARQVCQ